MEKQEKENQEINANTSLALYIPKNKNKTNLVYQALKYFLFFKLIFIFIFIDQITKNIIWNNKKTLWNIFEKADELHKLSTILDFFSFDIPENRIWILGMLGVIISLVFMYFLFFQKLPFIMGISITIMISGLLGNSYDFFIHKGVRNIIRGINGHFNVADIYIVFGLIFYTISIIYYVFIKDYFKK